MPIERGEEWGSAGVLPAEAPVAASDHETARYIQDVQANHAIVGVAGGDLARTLGVRAPYDRTTPKQLLPIDALRIDLDDGTSVLGVAHAMVGNLLWGSHVIAVMNAAFVGRFNLAPRAHPGDTKADIVTMRLGGADRLKARRRMVTGTHVPHPAIEIRRATSGVIELEGRRTVRVDGHVIGRSRTLTFAVEPDAQTIAV